MASKRSVKLRLDWALDMVITRLRRQLQMDAGVTRDQNTLIGHMIWKKHLGWQIGCLQ